MFSKSFIFIRIPALSTAVRVCGEGKVKGFVAKLVPCPAHTQSLPVASPPGAHTYGHYRSNSIKLKVFTV